MAFYFLHRPPKINHINARDIYYKNSWTVRKLIDSKPIYKRTHWQTHSLYPICVYFYECVSAANEWKLRGSLPSANMSSISLWRVARAFKADDWFGVAEKIREHQMLLVRSILCVCHLRDAGARKKRHLKNLASRRSFPVRVYIYVVVTVSMHFISLLGESIAAPPHAPRGGQSTNYFPIAHDEAAYQ